MKRERVGVYGGVWGVFCVLLCVTVWRVYYLSLEQFNLFFDEAQYWFWAQKFDWGYYSKPPMVAWMIGLTTSVCGDTEFCVRISSPILHMVTAVAVYYVARELYDVRVAFYSAVAYITLPAVSVSSALVSTDPSLMMFWALALLFFVKAVRINRLRWWLLSGVMAGLGMMSKYNMLLFLVSAILYLLVTKEKRGYLHGLGFWVAVVVALLIFLPNVWWNWQNGMVSFLHTQDNANISGLELHFDKMFEFVGAQFAVFGPIFFAVLLWVMTRIKFAIFEFVCGKDVLWVKLREFEDNDSVRLLLAFVVPLLAVIIVVSLLSRAHANWAAPVYVPATILVVGWLVRLGKSKLVVVSLALHLCVAVLLMNVYALGDMLGVKFVGGKTDLSVGRIKDPFKRLYGWEELGEGVSMLLQAYPGTKLLTDSRKIHSELLYYVKPRVVDAVKWNPTGNRGDHYEVTTDINVVGVSDFVFVTKRSDIADVADYFAMYERIGNIEIKRYDDYKIDYYVYLLKGFRGY